MNSIKPMSTIDAITNCIIVLGGSPVEADGITNEIIITSHESNANVHQLTDSLLSAGGASKILKGGFKEAITILGTLANNGIKGEEGGVSLRNIIFSLSSPTYNGSDVMKRVGLDVFDSSGEMRRVQDIFSDLNKIVEKMNDEERTEILSAMFNKVDLKSVNALLSSLK